MIYDWAMMALVYCFLLGDVPFVEPRLQVLSSWCFCCYKDWNTVAGLLFRVLYFCIGRYNWYLRDINIFPLLKKI
jgi:hypothetical protein